MIVNPYIKMIFKEISAQSIANMNSADMDRKYHRRLLKIYKEQLTEDEQIYLLKSLLESLNYRTIVTDPDNVLTLHTIKLKNVTYTFFLTIVVIIIAAALFKTNEALNGVFSVLTNAVKLLSI